MQRMHAWCDRFGVVEAGTMLLLLSLLLVGCKDSGARGYPEWRLLPAPKSVGCAHLESWVAKSGKEGVGITIFAKPTSDPECRLQVIRASLEIGEDRVSVSRFPVASSLARQGSYLYLPFVFDNERAWNVGDRRGVFILEVKAGVESQRIRMSMNHEWGTPHRPRRLAMPPVAPHDSPEHPTDKAPYDIIPGDPLDPDQQL